MQVPAHMEITASLMAGYTFSDGSQIELGGDDTMATHIITDANGEVIAEELGGMGMEAGIAWEDWGEMLDDFASFLLHDADLYDASRADSDDGLEGYIFSWEVAAWANARTDELSMLANYREDKRLGENDAEY